MGCAIINGLGGILRCHEPIDQTGSKTIATSHSVENFKIWISSGQVKLTVGPANGTPIIDGGGLDSTQCCGRYLEIRKLSCGLLNHFLEAVDFDGRNIFIHALHFETKACREIFLISNHDIDILGNVAVDLLRLGMSTNGLPERRAVIQIIGDHRTMLLGNFYGLFNNTCTGFGQGSKNTSRMEPSDSLVAEKLLPINVPGFHLGGCGQSSIRSAYGTANAETTFGEIEPVTHRSTNAIVGNPLNPRGIHPSLQNEIFQKASDIIFGKCGDDSRAITEAPSQAACHVVFPATFPDIEGASGSYTALTGVESQHDFPKGHKIIFAGFGRFDG